jgi:hypothetical protein
LNLQAKLFAAFLAACAWACTITPKIFLYNNSGRSVEVQFTNEPSESRVLPPGETLSFSSDRLFDASFLIRESGMAHHYSVPTDYPSMWLHPWLPASRLRGQLEPDLSIYLVPQGAKPPQSSFPEQPAGFPLRPNASQAAGAA